MKENSDNEKMKEHLGRLSLDLSVLTSFRKKESKGTNQLEEAFKHYHDIYIQMSDDKQKVQRVSLLAAHYLLNVHVRFIHPQVHLGHL